MDAKFSADLDLVSELSSQRRYDYIVVGSGFGGGLVAQQLSIKKKRVLLIEKGGATFLTHCLNTSRPHWQVGSAQGPSQDNDVVFNAVKQKIETAEGSDPYVGGPVYGLGGRSTVWGLFSPKIDKKTYQEYFPRRISDYLGGNGYTRAFEILTNQSQQYDNPYPTSSDISPLEANVNKARLKRAIESYYSGQAPATITISPLATQFSSPSPYEFPQGAYSTVDGILDRLYARDRYLTVLLNTEVLKVSYDQTEAGIYEARSLTVRATPEDRRVQLFAKEGTILCAGTLGTPKICLNSGLQETNPLIGKGLTDHEIWGVRFARKIDKKRMDPLKLQSQINVCGTSALLNVVINADHFLSKSSSTFSSPIQRFKKNASLPRGSNCGHGDVSSKRNDTINITIEYGAELVDDSEVIDDSMSEPVIRIKRKLLHQSEQCQMEMQALATSIRNNVLNISKDCPSAAEEPAPRLSLAGFGVVAHEVGTMRMESPGKKDFVVNDKYQISGFSNLYVLDLSIFPVSAPANPSLTLAALALQLVNDLADGDPDEPYTYESTSESDLDY